MFDPIDATTMIGDDALRIVVNTYYRKLEDRLQLLADQVSLVSWPEMNEVPIEKDLADWDGVGTPKATIGVVPQSLDDDQWYFLRVKETPPRFDYILGGYPYTADDGSTGARIYRGSKPLIRSIDICEKDGMSKIIFDFSEKITGECVIADVVEISVEGKLLETCTGDYIPRQEGSYSMTMMCRKIASVETVTLDIAPCYHSMTGVPLVDSATTVVFSLEPDGLDASCRRYDAKKGILPK